MLRVKIWLKIWEKLSFSCFHLLFLEAQVRRQYNLSWLHLGTKSWSIYTSSSGNGDLLSYKAIHVHCVHSRGPVWGFKGGSAGADIHLVCRPMGGRALSIREGGSELKGPGCLSLEFSFYWTWSNSYLCLPVGNVLVAFQSSLFDLAFKQFIYEVLRGGFFFFPLQCFLCS